MCERPFTQSIYDCSKLRKEDLSGYAYKFTLFIPISEADKVIFSDDDRHALCQLFNNDFGGVTYSKDVVHPLLSGEWKDDNGKVVVNNHARFEIYTQQSDTCIRYFCELKKNLEAHSGEQTIIVEKVAVHLIS